MDTTATRTTHSKENKSPLFCMLSPMSVPPLNTPSCFTKKMRNSPWPLKEQWVLIIPKQTEEEAKHSASKQHHYKTSPTTTFKHH